MRRIDSIASKCQCNHCASRHILCILCETYNTENATRYMPQRWGLDEEKRECVRDVRGGGDR